MVEIAAEFIHRYRVLLRTTISCSRLTFDIGSRGSLLSQKHKSNLVQLMTTKEIRKTRLNIRNDKTPRLDGYSARFFEASWETVGLELLDAIMKSFTFSILLK